MTEIKTEKRSKVAKEHAHHEHIKIFIVNVENESLNKGETKSFERKLCGLSMSDILVREFEGHDISFLECKFSEEDDILQKLVNGSLLTEKIAVLFSDEPCLSKFVVESALMSDSKLISFGKSFVIKTEFLKKLNCLCCLDEYAREPLPEFVVVDSEEKFLVAEQLINDKICKMHIKNGVNVNNCVIEFGAEIDAGAQLYESTISGNSNLGLCLIDGSSVVDSIIASGVKVEGCIIKNCIIGANVKNKKLENSTYMGEK